MINQIQKEYSDIISELDKLKFRKDIISRYAPVAQDAPVVSAESFVIRELSEIVKREQKICDRMGELWNTTQD